MRAALVTGVSRRARRRAALGRGTGVAWLASADARWITGQVIDSEGGFRRLA